MASIPALSFELTEAMADYMSDETERDCGSPDDNEEARGECVGGAAAGAVGDEVDAVGGDALDGDDATHGAVGGEAGAAPAGEQMPSVMEAASARGERVGGAAAGANGDEDDAMDGDALGGDDATHGAADEQLKEAHSSRAATCGSAPRSSPIALAIV